MTTGTDDRERQRYTVDQPTSPARGLQATLVYEDGEDVAVRIVDLSRWGAGFHTKREPRTGSDVLLTLHYREAQLRFRAHIKWASAAGDDQFASGCEFVAPLEQDFLSDLSRARILQPEATRSASWIRAVVRLDGLGKQKYHAEIINHSERGLCLASHKQFDPGTPLHVEVADGRRRIRIHATVAWERPETDCSLHGCTFADDKSASALAQAARRLAARGHHSIKPPHRPLVEQPPAEPMTFPGLHGYSDE